MSILNQLLYIDPAATSVLLASITSIIVACSATFIIIWRKLRKKFKKTLHIDENAGKEVEADLVINDEENLTKQTQKEELTSNVAEKIEQLDETENKE